MVARRAHNPKVVGSNPASAIHHVYAHGDIDTIIVGVISFNMIEIHTVSYVRLGRNNSKWLNMTIKKSST